MFRLTSYDKNLSKHSERKVGWPSKSSVKGKKQEAEEERRRSKYYLMKLLLVKKM
jgi:hypothetical protein